MDDFTTEKWNAMTTAGLYQDTEFVTTPSATALVKQAGLVGSSSKLEGVKVLDLGCGMGQLSEMLYQGNRDWQGEVVLGDIDTSLLQVCWSKVKANEWDTATVKKLDAWKLDLPDMSFTHVLANFLYAQIPNPMQAIKESIRVLQPGGTLGFTTWAHTGMMQLLLHAQTLIPTAPNDRKQTLGMLSLTGEWHDRAWLRQTLEELGLEDIRIEAFNHQQETSDAKAFAYAMRPVIKLMTRTWPRDAAWDMFERVEEVLRAEYGNGRAGVWSVSLIVTAKKSD